MDVSRTPNSCWADDSGVVTSTAPVAGFTTSRSTGSGSVTKVVSLAMPARVSSTTPREPAAMSASILFEESVTQVQRSRAQ